MSPSPSPTVRYNSLFGRTVNIWVSAGIYRKLDFGGVFVFSSFLEIIKLLSMLKNLLAFYFYIFLIGQKDSNLRSDEGHMV